MKQLLIAIMVAACQSMIFAEGKSVAEVQKCLHEVRRNICQPQCIERVPFYLRKSVKHCQLLEVKRKKIALKSCLEELGLNNQTSPCSSVHVAKNTSLDENYSSVLPIKSSKAFQECLKSCVDGKSSSHCFEGCDSPVEDEKKPQVLKCLKDKKKESTAASKDIKSCLQEAFATSEARSLGIRNATDLLTYSDSVQTNKIS